MSWVAVAVGLGSAAVGGVSANQERQRKKGIVGKAFGIAEQRQRLRQQDVRQSIGESLGARGLAAGGAVRDTGAVSGVTPSVAGAHDLGGQQMADLAREQSLEVQDTAARKNSELSNVNAEANSSMIGAAVNGISTAVGLKSSLNESAAAGTPGVGSGVMVDSAPGGNRYPGSYGGVDPVDPLGRGAWKSPATTGGFNKYNEVG